MTADQDTALLVPVHLDGLEHETEQGQRPDGYPRGWPLSRCVSNWGQAVPMLEATFSALPTTLMIEGLVPFRVGPIRPCIAATLGLGPPPSRQDLEAVRGDGRPGEAESSWLANSLGPTGQS